MKNKKDLQLSQNLEGLTKRNIYKAIGEKIKNINLSSLKKDKNSNKNISLLHYQELLEKISENHIKLEELYFQQESYLVNNYKSLEEEFLIQAASCFGVKKAYSLLIKNYQIKSLFHFY